ncbi:hypothetical protein ACWEIK_22250 [Streptomyces sp. NPDC004673]
MTGVHGMVGISGDQAGLLQLQEPGVGDSAAGGSGYGHPAGQQVFVELGSTSDAEQRRLVIGRK